MLSRFESVVVLRKNSCLYGISDVLLFDEAPSSETCNLPKPATQKLNTRYES